MNNNNVGDTDITDKPLAYVDCKHYRLLNLEVYSKPDCRHPAVATLYHSPVYGRQRHLVSCEDARRLTNGACSYAKYWKSKLSLLERIKAKVFGVRK